jgi:hypothetical protein
MAPPPVARCLNILDPWLNAILFKTRGLLKEVNSNFCGALQQELLQRNKRCNELKLFDF